MIMPGLMIPANVKNLYEICKLFDNNRKAAEEKYTHAKVDATLSKLDREVVERTYNTAKNAYYKARRQLVADVFAEMNEYDRLCVRNVLNEKGLRHIPIDEVRFYYDVAPITINDQKIWQIHIFYGRKYDVMGRGHGHIVALVTSTGAVHKIRRHRRPNGVTA